MLSAFLVVGPFALDAIRILGIILASLAVEMSLDTLGQLGVVPQPAS